MTLPVREMRRIERAGAAADRLAAVSNQQSGSLIPMVAGTLGIGDRRLAGRTPVSTAAPIMAAALCVSQPRRLAFMDVTVGAGHPRTPGLITSPPADRTTI